MTPGPFVHAAGDSRSRPEPVARPSLEAAQTRDWFLKRLDLAAELLAQFLSRILFVKGNDFRTNRPRFLELGYVQYSKY